MNAGKIATKVFQIDFQSLIEAEPNQAKLFDWNTSKTDFKMEE